MLDTKELEKIVESADPEKESITIIHVNHDTGECMLSGNGKKIQLVAGLVAAFNNLSTEEKAMFVMGLHE